VILIFGLVLTGAVVVTLGSTAIDDTQDQVSEDRAEKAMTRFDSKAALVALGNSDTQEVDFGTDRQSNYGVNDDTIAYQGGGVWKRIEANESRMVSPPGGSDTRIVDPDADRDRGVLTPHDRSFLLAEPGEGVRAEMRVSVRSRIRAGGVGRTRFVGDRPPRL
jgi:hypothetical protein